MARISNLSADDSRSDWKKISRRQYWKGLKALNIPCPVGATQSQMIGLSQAAGITPDQVAKFVPVMVATTEGGSKVAMLPENHERKYDEQKEHRRMEEMERRIAVGVENEEKRISADKLKMETEKNVEIQGLKTELEDLKAMMQKLLEQKAPKEKVTDPYKMKFMAQRKWLKEHGVELPKGGNAKDLIAQVLEDGKDTSDGS